MISDSMRAPAEALLAQAGFAPGAQFTRIDGGGNNQVFRAESGSRRGALKIYFHHSQDQRDRLNAEYSFSSLLWGHGVTSVPQPLALDRDARMGLYEFVEGEKLTAGQVDADALEAALDFFSAANTPGLLQDGQGLPLASEACFSVTAHLATVRRRLGRLDGLEGASPVDYEAALFVRDCVQPAWQALEKGLLAGMERLRIAPDEEIAADMRCLSPSDFGFHNALREPSGALRFVDFEYAGWDDPAKLVGDFFNQEQVPVPQALFSDFARQVAARYPAPERTLARFELLLPVYSMKWITIMLNDFLPEGGMRRSFAGDAGQAELRKQNQLAKARQAFDRMGAVRPVTLRA
jgi:hypothetical protein